MASACVNDVGLSPENFSASAKYPPCVWISPRDSLSLEDERADMVTNPPDQIPLVEVIDPVGDFESRPDDRPATMLPADELFCRGKLVPLRKQQPVNALTERKSLENLKCGKVEMEISGTDGYTYSPKAPRCSRRWRELLGLKRFSQNNRPASFLSSSFSNSNPKSSSCSSSLKHLLHRSSKSSSLYASSLNLPLLNESELDSLSISSSRLSLSSSSSGHEHEDLPRLSLDSEKQSLNHPSLQPCPNLCPNPFNPPRMRLVKARERNGRSPVRQSVGESSSSSSSSLSDAVMSRGVSVDSPRLNSSGKIIFQSLERSSSSPSSFNGGVSSGYRHRAGMDRSYSANVRVTPVLNVPFSSISKSALFGQTFSSSSSSSSSSSAQQKPGHGSSRATHYQTNKNRSTGSNLSENHLR